MVLYIPGDVRALEPEEALYARTDYPPSLPARPRFGPTQVIAGISNFSMGYGGIGSVHAGPSIQIDNSGSATIHLPPVDLRPGRHVDLEPFVLITAVDEAVEITAEWTATSTNRNGSLTGQLRIPRGEKRSFLDLFAADPQGE